ncbi:hypothetical protein HZA43_05375 [Candidatus Peregrinibacteria bacterium]|nr:hypothetical protein [Candidatus Peregrinibacteria bacterium]
MENTFLCLLPYKEDSMKLYERLSEVFFLNAFPVVKLPLHVTLFYFPASTNVINQKIIRWLDRPNRKYNGALIANTEKIASFAKNGRDFVYYLLLKSKKIFDFNHELHQVCKNNADQSPFIPHLSLFYPQRNLNKKEIKNVQKLFQDIKSISFDRIAFARENAGGISYISVCKI